MRKKICKKRFACWVEKLNGCQYPKTISPKGRSTGAYTNSNGPCSACYGLVLKK